MTSPADPGGGRHGGRPRATDPGGEPSRGGMRPDGKGALFGPPVEAPPEQLAPGPAPSGRAALFSVAHRRPGTAVITCSGCGERSRVRWWVAAARLVGAPWVPWRRHPHLAVCPACGRRRWLAVDFLG